LYANWINCQFGKHPFFFFFFGMYLKHNAKSKRNLICRTYRRADGKQTHFPRKTSLISSAENWISSYLDPHLLAKYAIMRIMLWENQFVMTPLELSE